MKAWCAIGVLVLLALGLAGCEHNMNDLHQFVAQARAKKVTKIPPIPHMTPYTPFSYEQAGRRDPFVPAEANKGKKTDQHVTSNGVHPDFSRPPQPLEQYPLDALHMVGTMNFSGVRYAMVTAPDGVIHRVTVGNYMGKHYGRVMKITATAIQLKEIIPDGFGGWRYQATSLSMAE